MAFHIYWPATVCLTFFIVGVIMVMLRYGPRICKVRHTPLPENEQWPNNEYDQRISYA